MRKETRDRLEYFLLVELIEFENLKDIYFGVVLTKIVNDLLKKYKLITRIISITTNNTSSNNTIIENINQYLKKAFIYDYFLNRKIQYILCFAYIIQFIIKALFGEVCF